MDFSFSDAQDQLYREAVDFAAEQLADDVIARDHAGTFGHDLWKRCAEFGVLGWGVPTEHGGHGHALLTVARMMEGLGYGCRDNGLTFALGAQMWGMQTAVLHFGSPEQIDRYVTPSIQGTRLGAYGMTEPGSGSDAFGLETTAAADGDTFVLNGEKALITFAPIADFAIVFAKTNPDAGRWGISAFLVDRETPGYTAHPVDDKMGLRTVPFGRISLQDCRVPSTAMLGKAGAGASIFSFSQGWERSLVLAPTLGAMQRQIECCVTFARDRKRAGTPIGKHQSIAHRIADMSLRLETCRLLLYKAAWLQQNNKPNLKEAAQTKIYLSESFVESSREAIAIYGGAGYQTAQEVERDLRDAIGGTIYGGTVDIQRNILTGLLGL